MVERDFIAEQAIDFQNRHYFGYIAAIHLEDAEDVRFWDTVLQKVNPGRYDYISYSKSKSGNDTRGCEQCLQYRDYLNSKFFICLDSDLRHLLKQSGMSAADHTAQTYTYSWENHYCFAERLQKAFAQRCLSASERFDFRVFLKGYSNVIYIPFLFLLYLKSKGLAEKFEYQFNILLPKQASVRQLENNGEAFCCDLSQKLMQLCQNHPLWPSFDPDAMPLEHSRLTVDNAYLYVRGHNVFDLISYIGEFLCYHSGVSFKSEILLSVLQEGCEDLDRVIDDLKMILL